MKPWHLRDPEGFEREKVEVEQKYPQLHFSVENDQIRIAGTLPIKDGQSVVDRFSIAIVLRADYPDSLPVVDEVGGRIPHILDRHFDDSGAACVLLPEDRWRSWPKGSSLLSFIDGPLRNYFIGQAMVEQGEPWPFGEWKHGYYGQLEYYKEVFHTDEPAKVRSYFDVLSAKKVKGHWACPCASGKRIRNCHMEFIHDLRNRIPRSETIKAAKLFEAAIQRLKIKI